MSINKKLSDKQIIWRKRAQLFWRLKGMKYYYFNINDKCVTDTEIVLLNRLNDIIKELNNNYTKNSIILGFNAKPRCFCGKLGFATEANSWYCKKHYEERVAYYNNRN